MKTKSERQETLFKALAHRSRIDILRLLRKDGASPVWYIANKSNLSIQATSRHLKVLHQSRLVEFEVQLNEHVYFLRPKQNNMVQYIVKKL